MNVPKQTRKRISTPGNCFKVFASAEKDSETKRLHGPECKKDSIKVKEGDKTKIADADATNNYPSKNWKFSSDQYQPTPSHSFRDYRTLAMTQNTAFASEELVTSNLDEIQPNINVGSLESGFENHRGGLHKKPKKKKIKLFRLTKLSKVLVKIFTKQTVLLEDLRLESFELHILVEILIRKNRLSGVSK